MTEKANFKFPKEKRLHHRSLVEGLFRLGKSFYEFPYRVTFRSMTPQEMEKNFRNSVPDGIAKVQVMVTVPKKKRRKAVDRVLMRRRIRESYRLNHHELEDVAAQNPEIRTLSIAFVFIHDKNIPYQGVETKMKKAISRIKTEISLNTEKLQ